MAATVNRIQIQDDQGNFYLPHTAADVVAFDKDGTKFDSDDVAGALREVGENLGEAVPNSRLENMPAKTVKGNAGNAAATPVDLTAAQLSGMIAGVPRVFKATINGAGRLNARTAAMTGFGRATGAIVAVEFDHKVTASSPSLNVQSTGAAAIRDFRTNAAPAPGMIGPGTHYFRYNGSQWVLLNPIGANNMGTCTSAAGTSAKLASLAGFTRTAGAVVGIDFPHANNADTLTLNVNSTGAASVRDHRLITNPIGNSNLGQGLNFFQFDGTYWLLLTSRGLMSNLSCSTSAAAIAKVTTGGEGTFRYTGQVVSVIFANANTAAAPTLNVNGTGAAAIRDFRTNAAPAAGTMGAQVHYFRYNGSHWVLMDPIGANNSGTCATTGSTAGKTISLSGFTLTTGQVVSVIFTNNNTATTPTLNVNSTGAKPIVDWRTGATPSPVGLWGLFANTRFMFEYNGSQWVMLNPICFTIPTAIANGDEWASQSAGHRTQELTIIGVTADMVLTCDINMEGLSSTAPDGYGRHRTVVAEASKIARVVSGTNKITVHTWGPDVPTENIPLIMKA